MGSNVIIFYVLLEVLLECASNVWPACLVNSGGALVVIMVDLAASITCALFLLPSLCVLMAADNVIINSFINIVQMPVLHLWAIWPKTAYVSALTASDFWTDGLWPALPASCPDKDSAGHKAALPAFCLWLLPRRSPYEWSILKLL